MKSSSHNRKVLFIEHEPVVRSLLSVLLSELGCKGEVAANGQQALAMLRQRDFDAVLLDLRSSDTSPEEVVSGIHEIQPSLIGRVLVITAEVDERETLDLVERYFLLKIPRKRLAENLAGCLRALLCIPPLHTQPRTVPHGAAN